MSPGCSKSEMLMLKRHLADAKAPTDAAMGHFDRIRKAKGVWEGAQESASRVDATT